MALNPYDPATDDEELRRALAVNAQNAQPGLQRPVGPDQPSDPFGRPRAADTAIPDPNTVTFGSTSHPSVTGSAHQTNDWDVSGYGQGGADGEKANATPSFHDYTRDVKPVDLAQFGQRPKAGIPQIGRPNSLLGAITGLVGGVQAGRQADWDARAEAERGRYGREEAQAREQSTEQYRQENSMASWLRAQRTGNPKTPIIGTHEGQSGVWYPTGDGGMRWFPGATLGAVAAADTRGGHQENVADINTQGRKDVANINVAGHDRQLAQRLSMAYTLKKMDPNRYGAALALGGTALQDLVDSEISKNNATGTGTETSTNETDTYDPGGHKTGKRTVVSRTPASGPKPFGIKPPLGNAGGGSTAAPEGTRISGPKGDLIKKNGKWVPVSN